MVISMIYFVCKYYFTCYHIIYYIFSIDDVDAPKMIKNAKTLWQDASSTHINLTLRHKARKGTTAMRIGICNRITNALAMEPEQIRRRIWPLLWNDHIHNLTIEERKQSYIKMQKFIKQFKNKAVAFFCDINFEKYHHDYYEKILSMYKTFADVAELRSIIPSSMLKFQAIVLQVIYYIARRIIAFDVAIIDNTFAQILRATYAVCILELYVSTSAINLSLHLYSDVKSYC